MIFLSGRTDMMRLIVYVLLMVMYGGVLSAQDIPPRPDPPRLVNDIADVLSESDETILEQKLRAYNDSTSTQIAVVTVRDVGGYDVVDFAYRIGEQWGVGQKGKNNGIVILVSIDDRKAAIVTGYGMEGAIPDIVTRRIRENYMNPNFRNGDFYRGLDEASTAIMKYAAGEYTADDLKGPNNLGIGVVILLVFIFFIVISIVSAVKKTRRNNLGGKAPVDFWTAFWLMSQMGGKRRGRDDHWGGGGFGGFGGGGGGGFGGFGGGSFGGGGSGGSW